MQKAKKMSKQTLVIAVLAVLLVLSLALSVTGAWFTDTATDTAKKDIQFGTVAVDATGAKASVTGGNFGENKRQLLLPGDTVSLGGDISNETSTVDVYIGIKIGAIKVMGTTNTLTVGQEQESLEALADAAFTIDLTTALAGTAALTLGSLTEGVTTVDENIDDLIILKVTAGKKTVTYSGSFTVPPTTGNVVDGTTEDGPVECVLNKGAAGIPDDAEVITGVRISATVDVVALQVDNVPAGDVATTVNGLFTA